MDATLDAVRATAYGARNRLALDEAVVGDPLRDGSGIPGPPEGPAQAEEAGGVEQRPQARRRAQWGLSVCAQGYLRHFGTLSYPFEAMRLFH